MCSMRQLLILLPIHVNLLVFFVHGTVGKPCSQLPRNTDAIKSLSVTIWITDPENQGSQVVIPMEPEEYGESDYGQAAETPASPTAQPLPSATPAVTAPQGDSGYEDADEEGETDYGQPVGTPAVTEPPAPAEEGSDYGETEEPEEQEEQEEREEQEEQEEEGDSDYGDEEEDDD